MMHPLMDGKLRKNRRLMQQESKALGRKLGGVEQLMSNAVFEFFSEYDEVYQVYLEVYQKVMSRMKPKYLHINPMYFVQMYKPINQGYTLQFISNLHELARSLFGQREEN